MHEQTTPQKGPGEASNVIQFPPRPNAPRPSKRATNADGTTMLHAPDVLFETCGLSPGFILRIEPREEYRRGDVIAGTIKSTALYRGGFTAGRVRRITHTRVSIENDRGAFVFNLSDVKLHGKVVECWRRIEGWDAGADAPEDWPEYVEDRGAA
jgi:hypothetical protein